MSDKRKQSGASRHPGRLKQIFSQREFIAYSVAWQWAGNQGPTSPSPDSRRDGAFHKSVGIPSRPQANGRDGVPTDKQSGPSLVVANVSGDGWSINGGRIGEQLGVELKLPKSAQGSEVCLGS